MALTPYIHNISDPVEINRALRKLASNKLGPKANPTFVGLTLTSLTASRLIQSDGSKGLSSVSDLTAWIAGTTNQITVTDNADGTVTLSAPQDIHTGASPTFAGLTSTGTIDASAGKVRVEDNDTIEPSNENDGYVGVAKINMQPRIYFTVDGIMYYIAAVPITGNPIGLLLCFTYA